MPLNQQFDPNILLRSLLGAAQIKDTREKNKLEKQRLDLATKAADLDRQERMFVLTQKEDTVKLRDDITDILKQRSEAVDPVGTPAGESQADILPMLDKLLAQYQEEAVVRGDTNVQQLIGTAPSGVGGFNAQTPGLDDLTRGGGAQIGVGLTDAQQATVTSNNVATVLQHTLGLPFADLSGVNLDDPRSAFDFISSQPGVTSAKAFQAKVAVLEAYQARDKLVLEEARNNILAHQANTDRLRVEAEQGRTGALSESYQAQAETARLTQGVKLAESMGTLMARLMEVAADPEVEDEEREAALNAYYLASRRYTRLVEGNFQLGGGKIVEDGKGNFTVQRNIGLEGPTIKIPGFLGGSTEVPANMIWKPEDLNTIMTDPDLIEQVFGADLSELGDISKYSDEQQTQLFTSLFQDMLNRQDVGRIPSSVFEGSPLGTPPPGATSIPTAPAAPIVRPSPRKEEEEEIPVDEETSSSVLPPAEVDSGAILGDLGPLERLIPDTDVRLNEENVRKTADFARLFWEQLQQRLGQSRVIGPTGR